MNTIAPVIDEILGRVSRSNRNIVTPDGVALHVGLSDVGERYAAFAADFFITLLPSCCVEVLGWLAEGRLTHQTLVISTFLLFVVQACYFITFELRWSGVTPGKRMLGLRVIDRRGGPLLPGAVVARNLTRQVEFFFPLSLFLAGASWVRAPWEAMVIVAWIALMGVLPLLNREHLRLGDLVGGTISIALPKRILLDDLAVELHGFTFTADELQFYGIAELQVLEDVLRNDTRPDKASLEREICAKINARIGREHTIADSEVHTFLASFYTAQRAYLEIRKNLGDTRVDKHYNAKKNT